MKRLPQPVLHRKILNDINTSQTTHPNKNHPYQKQEKMNCLLNVDTLLSLREILKYLSEHTDYVTLRQTDTLLCVEGQDMFEVCTVFGQVIPSKLLSIHTMVPVVVDVSTLLKMLVCHQPSYLRTREAYLEIQDANDPVLLEKVALIDTSPPLLLRPLSSDYVKYDFLICDFIQIVIALCAGDGLFHCCIQDTTCMFETQNEFGSILLSKKMFTDTNLTIRHANLVTKHLRPLTMVSSMVYKLITVYVSTSPRTRNVLGFLLPNLYEVWLDSSRGL